jgi:protease I
MAADLSGKKVAVVATNYFEEAELTEPCDALRDNGAEVDIIAPEAGTIQGLKHVDKGKVVVVDKVLAEIDPSEYDALVLPGGAINADQLRMNEQARAFVATMLDSGKPTAVICHAPWVLVSANLVKNRHLTSYPTIQDDIKNAGGEWSDEEVVIDDNLITSRKPDDIPAFNKALFKALANQ